MGGLVQGENSVSRTDIRRAARVARDGLSPRQRSEANEKIALHILKSPPILQGTTFGLYASYRGEVDTGSILQALLRQEKRVFLPKVLEQIDGLDMTFYPITGVEQLQPGFKGILEPPQSQLPSVEPDVLIVPGLAFSAGGGRLGYGAGTYDRYLEHKVPLPLLIGLSFECQMVDFLPTLPHDIPMNMIVTEERVIDCGAGSNGESGSKLPS